MSEQTPERTRLTINWLQIAGGALAAVTSAFVLAGLKSLGPFGTLLGAAVGSVAASTAAAIYNHYLTVSSQRLADAARRARERRHDPSPVPAPQDEHPERTDPPVPAGGDETAQLPPVPAGEDEAVPPRRRRIRPGHVVLLGVLAFVISVGAIFGYEQLSGRSVAAERQGSAQSTDQRSILGTTIPPAATTAEPTDSATATDGATATEPSGDASATATESSADEPTSTATSSATSTTAPTERSSATATATRSSGSTATATATGGSGGGSDAGSSGSGEGGERQGRSAPSPTAGGGDEEAAAPAPSGQPTTAP
ncbi:hypothetical protein [Kineococcus sp. SYSU DK005]|uniref:hypothetical protein n=1 Tax=Kineococcus sp. SYSU DK005 TaxID=3383126 RepID=UPI003D7ED277